VAQSVGHEFKPQHHTQKKKKKEKKTFTKKGLVKLLNV
jgi:hypothetical protein